MVTKVYKLGFSIMISYNRNMNMEQKITFNIDNDDKRLIEKKARDMRLSVSSFCRTKVLDKIYPETDFQRQISNEQREEYQLKNSLGVAD